MFNVNKIYFYIVFLSLISLFSCKKDVDEKGPEIKFNTPTENQTFNVYDYVTVNATVTDDVKISSVAVSLLDVNQNYAHITLPVTVSSPSMTLNMAYFLDNIHLETGFYYIKITASDGTNDSHKFQKIYLIAVPKVLTAIYVVSNTGSSQTNLSTIDAAFTSLVPYNTFSGDHLSSSVSSYHQQAYMCGNYTGNFTGHVLAFNSPKFIISPIPSSNPYFTGYYNNDRDTYVARYDGNIKGYNYSGGLLYNASALSGYYAQHMCFNDGYLIAEEKEIFTATKKLATYFSTGSIEKNCALTQDVVAFCEMDASNVFVFGNVAGQATIELFDRANNNLWSPYPFILASGNLLSALKLDSDTYLLGHSNGTIYKYQYSSNSVTTYLTSYTAVKLKYDDVQNKLYVVEANRITTFDLSTLAIVNTVNSTETILDAHLLYNR